MFNKSKWLPLTIYFNEMMTRYLLMGRRNSKTGIISFKSIRVNKLSSHNPFLISLEMSKQFEKLLEEGEEK